MRILSVKEVAGILNTSPQNVRLMVYRGKLPARKFGRRLIFIEEELRKHLEALPRVGKIPEREG